MANIVTIIGLGSLGSILSEMFARHGVNMRIIDKERVYDEEMKTLSLFIEDDIKKFKAKQAKTTLERINPKVKIRAFHEELNPNNVFLVGSNVVMDCSNNLDIALMIDKFCHKKRVPAIYTFLNGTKGHIFVSKKKSLAKMAPKVKKDGETSGASAHMAAGIVFSITMGFLRGEKITFNSVSFDTASLSVRKQK
jgi:molybdopterin/thiamine biosynthesis adenylyltransferase